MARIAGECGFHPLRQVRIICLTGMHQPDFWGMLALRELIDEAVVLKHRMFA